MLATLTNFTDALIASLPTSKTPYTGRKEGAAREWDIRCRGALDDIDSGKLKILVQSFSNDYNYSCYLLENNWTVVIFVDAGSWDGVIGIWDNKAHPRYSRIVQKEMPLTADFDITNEENWWCEELMWAWKDGVK